MNRKTRDPAEGAAVRRMRDRHSQILFLSYNSGLQELICDET